MTTKTNSRATSAHGLALRKTLADVLAAVERNAALSPTRLRDLRSSVMRVGDLLGNVPARIALDLPTIASRLAAISPVAAGMTPKRFANDISLAADLGSLRGTLKLICPNTDWSWLQSIANRTRRGRPPPARKYNLVTSDRLYALGIELMDNAVTAADAVGRTGTRQAIQYRDGLIISTLAMIPLRRGTLAALQIGRHLIKVGDHWELDIPAADTKTRRPLDYSIPKDLSARIDLYLERFRSRIRGSDKHAGLWPSHHSIPMRPELH